MLYPRPGPSLLQHWDAAVQVLRENSHTEHSVLQAAYPTTLEIIVASPGNGDRFVVGERSHRDSQHYCDELLRRRLPLCVPDASRDAQWDSTEERRSGILGYCGTPLLWPDDEPFGTLAFLNGAPLTKAQVDSGQRLLGTLATGINAQLELLFRKQQHHYESTHDALTGLANRLLFLELAKHQLQRHKRSGAELWLLLWTIDDYRSLRKNLDPGEADTLIRAMVERSQSCIRQSDVFARLDDNCFALLISEANEFVASAVVDRIRRNTRRIQFSDRVIDGLTLSCGMSSHQGQESLDSWIKRADMAMRAAVAAGGNQGVALG
jgi:diguanylate cyclase (GGDEF)-like protein